LSEELRRDRRGQQNRAHSQVTSDALGSWQSLI
jgi:hypothetical protein